MQLVVRFSCVDMDEYMGVPREELQKTYGGPPFDRSRLWHMDLSDEATPPQVGSATLDTSSLATSSARSWSVSAVVQPLCMARLA